MAAYFRCSLLTEGWRLRFKLGPPVGPFFLPTTGPLRWQVIDLAQKLAQQLAERMKKYGFKEIKASVVSKLSRATVAASFFLAALAAMGCEQVTLEDI